jgi:hypothetical protein
MFFILNQPTAKILPFRAKAKPDYSNREQLPKLSDFRIRDCQTCEKYGSRRNDGFVIYGWQYTGNPGEETNRPKTKDYAEIDLCPECYAKWCPELAKFIQ